MAEDTLISWATHTQNFWIGCTEVSPACAFCYARELANFHGWAKWGDDQPRYRTSPGNWRKPYAWNKKAEGLAPNNRPRVFTNSLADFWDEAVPVTWLGDALTVIAETPNLWWLILTKRPEVIAARLTRVYSELYNSHPKAATLAFDWLMGVAPENVWLGITAENQKWLELRLERFLMVAARLHFLSCEPLLGPLNLPEVGPPDARIDAFTGQQFFPVRGKKKLELGRIGWVITGGESGRKPRPSSPNWFRSLQRQCFDAGVPFHFKQWGELGENPLDGSDPDLWVSDAGQVVTTEAEAHLRSFDEKTCYSALWRRGTKKTGHLLNCTEYLELPNMG